MRIVNKLETQLAQLEMSGVIDLTRTANHRSPQSLQIVFNVN